MGAYSAPSDFLAGLRGLLLRGGKGKKKKEYGRAGTGKGAGKKGSGVKGRKVKTCPVCGI